MIIPIFTRTSTVIREWIKGRNARDREREDRATAHTIAQDLEEGGVWFDRDGPRTRFILRPGRHNGLTIDEQLAHVEPLLQLEPGDDATPQRPE